jgi:cytochrome c oxidase cbb3-type subunit III
MVEVIMPHANKFLCSFAALGALFFVTEAAAQAHSHADHATTENAPSDLLDVPATSLIPGDIKIKPGVENPAAEDSGSAQRGMKYFANFNCSGCHAANGGGGMGPALSNRAFIYGDEPEQIYLSIAQGRPAGMPAWGTVLPKPVIWDLVSYIRSISDAPNPQWGSTTSLEAFTIEQVPAEFKETPDPWKYTEPFSFGQQPRPKKAAGEG